MLVCSIDRGDAMHGFDDFDFLVGDWTVANERLRTRLKGAADWERFGAVSRVEKVMPLHGVQPGAPLPSTTPPPSSTSGRAAGMVDPLREPVVYGGNLDQMFVPEKGFTGMTLRLYDPATHLWSIYWSDTISHRLFPPTVGRFEGGLGLFLGDDVEASVPVKVRFVWTPGVEPVWEQAMSTDGGASWEVNWIMRFHSRPAP